MLTLIRDMCGLAGSLGYIDLPSGQPPDHPAYRIYTLERPWVPCVSGPPPAGNMFPPPCGQKGVSCIPPGVYDLVPHNTEAHPDTFALVNPDLWVYHFDSDVPREKRGYARTAVLIHPANWVEELRGCIAPGMHRQLIAPVAGRPPMIERSREAFALLRPYLKDSKQIGIVSL